MLLLGIVPLVAAYRDEGPAGGVTPSISVPELLGGEVGEGFAQPSEHPTFDFPKDHGPHRNFRTEWWYFTGNLAGAGHEFGYELTLFRQALASPLQSLIPRTSQWASSQAILGHFAISDLSGGKFYHFQRLSRAALGLAGCQPPPNLAWVEDWRIGYSDGKFSLTAEDSKCSIDLHLESRKQPVLQGKGGYSRKDDGVDQASQYYSLTRLQTRGTVSLPSGPTPVTGLSWMDREWSTRPMGSDLAGWDWFALQTNDDQEFMFYQLRDKRGASTRWSAGSWVNPGGEVTRLSADQVKIEVTDGWQSPLDGTRYPAGWLLTVPERGVKLQVRPRLANQELTGLGRYWEGAVSFQGQDGEGHELAGTGYVELVGYSAAGFARGARY